MIGRIRIMRLETAVTEITSHAADTSATRDGALPSAPVAAISRVTTRDGAGLALYRWTPEGTPRATVALVHGLAEHAGRYTALAHELNAVGIELVAIDLRGHGLASGARVWIKRFDDYLDDADTLLSVASRPGTPLFLMGHSMGGTVAALHAIERAAGNGPKLHGLILSSPALAAGRDVPRWMITMSRIISRVWPRFPAMKIDASLLSRDPAVVEANRGDPLVHHAAVPARTGAEILDAMTRIERGRASLRLPLLVWHGTADRLTEPDGSRDFGAHAGSPDKTLTLYNDSYHETMNDLDRDRVISALIQWILARAG
nr:alpha/beta hydrolase [Paraburkholderia gardini]